MSDSLSDFVKVRPLEIMNVAWRKSPPIVNEMFPSQSFIEEDYSEKRLKNHSSEHQAGIISDLSAASSQCCRYCCCVSLVLRQTARFHHKKKAAESWHSMMKAWHQLQRDHVQTSSCEHTLTSLIEAQECPNRSSFKRREMYFYCSRKESYFYNVTISSDDWRWAWDQTNLFWSLSSSKLEEQEQCPELNVHPIRQKWLDWTQFDHKPVVFILAR